eukprot:6167668-Pyramimonas_sp.AAC.1
MMVMMIMNVMTTTTMMATTARVRATTTATTAMVTNRTNGRPSVAAEATAGQSRGNRPNSTLRPMLREGLRSRGLLSTDTW